jgi:pimeloyl-ACP methyl ester carboxylesterase
MKWVAAIALTAIAALSIGMRVGARGAAPKASSAMPPASIPTFSTEDLGRKAIFYVGGAYAGPPGKEVMHGAMYVEVWVPKQIRRPYPVVMFHGNGQTGAVWQQTPDGRPGWAYYLLHQGYVVYMVDYPARGRSPYVPSMDGPLNIRTGLDLEQIWTAPVESGGDFPRKKLYTQWPSSAPHPGMMGDPVFDNFIKGQMQYIGKQDQLAVPAGVALLDKIGTPVILLTHSQGGGIGFNVADQRPNLIAGMVSIEPGGPQIGSVDLAKVTYTKRNEDSWGLTNIPMHYDPPVEKPSDLKVYLEDKSERPDEVPCYMQQDPPKKLVSYEKFHILSISAEGTYHRVYDHCIPKWINQAGGHDEFIRLEDVNIHGNMHEMFLDKNSDQVIAFIDDWMRKNVK